MQTSRVLFPDGATDEERAINWQHIGEISDSDFGFDTPKEHSDDVRLCVRILLLNDKGEICIIKSEKYGYLQLPGGGIDDDESIIEALRREAEEETGFHIKDIEPIGIMIENRGDVRNVYPWGRSVSYVFKVLATETVGTHYTEYEAAEEFKPIWISLDDFIATQEQNDGKTDDYVGCFANRRDLEIARVFRSMQG